MLVKIWAQSVQIPVGLELGLGLSSPWFAKLFSNSADHHYEVITCNKLIVNIKNLNYVCNTTTVRLVEIMCLEKIQVNDNKMYSLKSSFSTLLCKQYHSVYVVRYKH